MPIHGLRRLFIAYGTDLKLSSLTNQDEKVRNFFGKWQSKEDNYYLIVGRFCAGK